MPVVAKYICAGCLAPAVWPVEDFRGGLRGRFCSTCRAELHEIMASVAYEITDEVSARFNNITHTEAA